MVTTSTRRTPTARRTSSIIGYYQRNPERTAMSAGECDDPWSYLSSVWMASLVCLILIFGSFDQHTSPGTALPEGGGRLYVEKRLPCHRYNGFKRGRGPAPSTLVDHPQIIIIYGVSGRRRRAGGFDHLAPHNLPNIPRTGQSTHTPPTALAIAGRQASGGAEGVEEYSRETRPQEGDRGEP